MTMRISIAGLCALLLWGTAAMAEHPATEQQAGRPPVEIVHELDAYYSNIGIYIPLTGEPIPDVGEQGELAIYRQLLKTSWPPRFMLIEFSVDPLPIAGVYLKKNHREFYPSFDLGTANLIESVTAGFQEPYALTLFFGNLATFVSTDGERRATNKGFMGYMFSIGNRHIKDNVLIDDHWLEMEWKLKGDRVFQEVKHHWSFRLGSVLHSHPEIADAFYIGLRRSLLDFNGPVISWLNNSHITLRSDFSLKEGRYLRQEVTLGKKYPLKNLRRALSLTLGFIWESPHRYGPALREPHDAGLTIVLRPNLEF
jgi:hypothetical protein